jgi:chromate transporter
MRGDSEEGRPLVSQPVDPAGDARPAAPINRPEPVEYTLSDLTRYALRLGALGFGGPVALVGYMRRDLVERRRWIAEADYNEGLALAQLAPGPLAAQLAMYLGYVHHRIRGAALVGAAFVAPAFLMVVALGWAYVRFGGLPWIRPVFYGVGAGVIGIIAASAYKLTRRTVGRDPLLWAAYAALALTTILTASEQVLLVLIAGVAVRLVKAPPRHLWDRWKRRERPERSDLRSDRLAGVAPFPLASIVVSAAGAWGILWPLFLFFVEAGAVVFGSGLAIVPFLYGGVVREHHWLTNQQFVDAVAVALLTPGPVVITSGFIGFLVAGLAGACVATLGTFLPAFVFTIALAPAFKRYGKRPGVAAFVQGVTAAAVGAITGAVVILGRQTIVDLPTAALALATLGVLLKTSRVPEPLLVLGAALIGLVTYPLFHR